ncbi:MAG: metallophosphoesterase [Candidatus Woesearchaeota archaeon]|nr:metallophosphoesterase [Candidatus Woesearchaeota archaeon]
MKFLIIGDLHGNRPKIYFKEFDAIIAPGDFCSDALRTVMFQALQLRLKDPKSKVMWWELISRRKAQAMIDKSRADGRKILEYLNTLGVPVYVLPGNWDWTKDPESKFDYLRKDHWKFLIKGLNNIHDMHLRFLDIGKFQLIGHGITSGPEYPQHKEELARFTKAQLTHKKKKYDLLHKQVDNLFRKATKPVIFLSHNVPFNTPIDMILDTRSPRYGLHFGSLLAREMIDKHQPLVCVGAHMHEHFTSHQMDKTTAINAGFGSNVNVWLEVEGNTIKKLEFKRR